MKCGVLNIVCVVELMVYVASGCRTVICMNALDYLPLLLKMKFARLREIREGVARSGMERKPTKLLTLVLFA